MNESHTSDAIRKSAQIERQKRKEERTGGVDDADECGIARQTLNKPYLNRRNERTGDGGKHRYQRDKDKCAQRGRHTRIVANKQHPRA